MAAIHDNVLGNLSAGKVSGTDMHICSTDPGVTYATVTANTLGTATDTMTGPAASTQAASGVEILFPQISAGTVTNDGDATHWAITNGSSQIIASGALSASQTVTSGNTFSLDQVSVAILDAT